MATNEWWGLNDSLLGGETFTSNQNRKKLHIKKGDQFRIEQGRNGGVTLIPSPDNKGTWNETYSKGNPITLTPVDPKQNRRAYSMMVLTSAQEQAPVQLFLVERKNFTVAIKNKVSGGGADDNSASVEH